MGVSDTPRYWWDRAEEARVISDVMSDLIAKRRMLEVADGFARLAARADALLAVVQTPIPERKPESSRDRRSAYLMSHPIIWLSLVGAPLLCLVVARSVHLRSRRDTGADEGPSPGDIEPGRYLASGHVAWKGPSIFRRRRRSRQSMWNRRPHQQGDGALRGRTET
jgi:hypothetical protein